MIAFCFSWGAYKLSGIQGSKLGEAQCVNDNREHGVSLINWEHWATVTMMPTSRVKGSDMVTEQAGDVWGSHASEWDSGTLRHLTRAALPQRVCTAVLGNSLEVMLSPGHAPMSASHLFPSHQSGDRRQDFKATTEGLCFCGNFVNKQRSADWKSLDIFF